MWASGNFFTPELVIEYKLSRRSLVMQQVKDPCCHCSCCGAGFTPGLGTSVCYRRSQGVGKKETSLAWSQQCRIRICILSRSLVFFFLNCCTHDIGKFPWPGIESEPQLRPVLQSSSTSSFNPLCFAGDWIHASAVTRAIAVRFFSFLSFWLF